MALNIRGEVGGKANDSNGSGSGQPPAGLGISDQEIGSSIVKYTKKVSTVDDLNQSFDTQKQVCLCFWQLRDEICQFPFGVCLDLG